MAHMPTTTLSIGAMVPSSNHSSLDDHHHSLETILRLKSWNEDPSMTTSYHSLKDKLEGLMETGTRKQQQQQGSGSHSSGKGGLKRKRGGSSSGGLSVTVYEEMDSGRISLGLGHMEKNCREDMDKDDSVTVLALGHFDTLSGNNKNNSSFSEGLRDESVHGGSATALSSMQAKALSPGVLLQLGNMEEDEEVGDEDGDEVEDEEAAVEEEDEEDPDAGTRDGAGWQVEGGGNRVLLYNAHADAVKLGLGSSRNASNYESCGERMLGLGNEKSATKRWECPSFFGGSGGGVQVPVVDEGSSSARVTCGGYMPSLLMGNSVFAQFPSLQANKNGGGAAAAAAAAAEEEDFMEQNLSMSFQQRGTSTTSTSSRSGHSDRPLKVCKFRGCGKGPRGASGLCIAHGGGRRCQKHGCNKGAEGRTVYCKAHGGGRRCQNLGCTKSAEGKTDYCIGHGGGRRCSKEGCDKAARGRSGLCIRHGGGKRCQVPDCTKSAEGYTGLCISHGGGRRCQFSGCSKGAQGSTMFCKAHGGGKRCIIKDCNKGAEGSTPLCKGHGGGKRCMYDGGGICTKSVHGGTLFCVAHGGGKRCAVEGCSKSARGRTDHCVKHGGGKRCKVDGCGKSAQGSTDFCKAHGGGKRCQWGVEGSVAAAANSFKDGGGSNNNGGWPAGAPCDKFARGKSGLCAAHSALVQDRRVHGGGTMGNAVTAGLAPGLFRGLVSGSGQTRPGTTTNVSTTSSGLSTTPIIAASSSSRAAAASSSAPDKEMCSPATAAAAATQGFDLHGPSRRQAAADDAAAVAPPPHGARVPPVEILTGRGLELPESSLSSQGFEAVSLDSTGGPDPSSFEGSSSGHTPYGGDLAIAQDDMANNFSVSRGAPPPSVDYLAAAAGSGLNKRFSNFLPPAAGLGGGGGSSQFQNPLIPAQVLVPLSMQRRDGRPPRPPNPTNDERVFLKASSMVSEERVRGGSLMEGRVRGGGLITLLSQEAAAPPNNNGGGRVRAALGTGVIEHMRTRQPTRAEMENQASAVAANSNMLHEELTSPDRNGSLGIDVGQFLATGVNFN